MRHGQDGALRAEASRIVETLGDHALTGVEVPILTRDELQGAGEIVPSPVRVIGVTAVLAEPDQFGKADQSVGVQMLVARGREIGTPAAVVITVEQRVRGKAEVV